MGSGLPRPDRANAWCVQHPRPGEPCRFDLREHACFPYPPVENQGNDVTCVAHAFAMALYCSLVRARAHSAEVTSFPDFAEIFSHALSKSPDKKRGVSFEAVAQGAQALYASELRELDTAFTRLPNDASAVREALLLKSPVIVGYQVDGGIENFHQNSRVCESRGFMLPYFGRRAISISGHAVLLLGYDFRVQAFIARNSWGVDWGVGGHFLIPFASVEDPWAFTDIWALASTARARADIFRSGSQRTGPS